MSLRISVVVPTYKRPDLLNRCLDSLRKQDLDPGEYEIVVVQDSSPPIPLSLQGRGGTLQFPSPLQGDLRVRQNFIDPAGRTRGVPREGRRESVGGEAVPSGPAAARNAGWRAARAPIIAFTDDDTIPDPHWLSAGLAALAGGADAAWGTLVMPIPETPTDYEKDAAGLAHAEFVTANCFVRREALEAIGGFDERFRLAWREDSDLFFSLLQAGKRVVRAPEAVVVHPVRPGRWGISLKQQKKSLFDALLFKKHPDLFRRRLPGGTPWRYYAIVAALGVLPWALTHRAGAVAGLAFVLWAGLTADFCRRRLASTSRALSHVAEMVVTSMLIPPVAVFWRLAGALRFKVLFL